MVGSLRGIRRVSDVAGCLSCAAAMGDGEEEELQDAVPVWARLRARFPEHVPTLAEGHLPVNVPRSSPGTGTSGMTTQHTAHTSGMK